MEMFRTDWPEFLKFGESYIKAIGRERALVVNMRTERYHYGTPDEYRIAWNSKDIAYDWELQMK